MTELEALNMLLRLIGSSPVNSLETPHPDAVNAKATLDRIRKKSQRRGWWFNIDYGVDYTPNERGEIELAKQVTEVVMCDTHVVKRSNKLYDNRNQTYLFVEVQRAIRTVRMLEWDELPDCMKDYCAYAAGVEYIRDELEDPSKQAELKESAAMAMLDVRREDLESGQYNMFNKTRAIQARAGVQPYHRNNKRFYGDPDV